MSVIHVHVVCKQFIVSWLISILSHITFLFNFEWNIYMLHQTERPSHDRYQVCEH